MTQMKRNENDKRGNGFWWLVVIMCTDFRGIHLVDMWPYGCFIFFVWNVASFLISMTLQFVKLFRFWKII